MNLPHKRFWGMWTCPSSAKCNSVRKPHAILPDTPGDLTSTSKYFQTLPGPPGAKQSDLRLCKSIFGCSWKHLQLWRCIPDAPSRIVKFRNSWDLCADLRETSKEAETAGQLCRILREPLRLLFSSVAHLMPYSHSSGSYITTRHFVLSFSSLLQSQVVLATGSNARFGSGSGSDPEPDRCNGFPHKTRSSKVNISCSN